MKRVALKEMIVERTKFCNDYENAKISELLKRLDENLCEQIAFDLSTKIDGRLNLKILLDIIKAVLIQNAVFLANKSVIIGADEISRFDENQKLRAYYFKKALKQLPEWARKAILSGENEPKRTAKSA